MGALHCFPGTLDLTSATKVLQQHSNHHEHSNEQKHRSDLQECKISSFFIHPKVFY
jgi:hypothetical protein